MTQKLLNYLTYILLIIPFTLLIKDPNVLFPFITTKAILFRILVSFGLFLVTWIYLLNSNTFPKKNFLFIATVLFFLANILATIFSVNPYRSFWGNAERMEGLWSLFFYLSYFFLLITLFQFNPKTKKTIFYSFLIVTTLISFLEINEAFVLKIERPSATLGNPTYIGFLNLLTIFLILFFYFGEKNFFNRFLFLFLILINLLSLIASQTRGSILGLLTGIFAGAIFYVLFSNLSLKRKISIFALFLIFLIIFYFFLKTEISLKIPGIKRISETLQNPASVFPRLYSWKIFLSAFKARPIFGWGPETEPIAFFAHFDPQIFNFEQAIFDRPHNKFVEILVKSGILGFLTWFSIFFAFIYYLFKNKTLDLKQKSSLFGFLFAYFGQIFTLFDMQASYLLLFFGLSLVVEKIEFKENRERFIRPYLVLAGGIALIFIIIHFQHYYIVNKIITYLREDNPELASKGFLRISEIAGPFLTEEAVMVSNYIFANANKINKFENFLNFYQVIKTAYQKDPNDYRLNAIYIGNLYVLINTKKQAGIDVQNDIKDLKKVYENLLNKYPQMPEIYINYAKYLHGLNEKKSAEEILKKGEEKFIKIYPRYLIEEGAVYLSFNEKEIAYQKLKKALENNFQFKFDRDFENALNIYLANGDVENSKVLINNWLKVNNSISIKEKIKQILEDYGYKEILNFDK